MLLKFKHCISLALKYHKRRMLSHTQQSPLSLESFCPVYYHLFLNQIEREGSSTMSTQNRRSSVSSSSSSSSSSLMKRSSSGNHSKVAVAAALPHWAKKRQPLGNLTNQKNASLSGSKSSAAAGTMAPSATKISRAKKGPSKNPRSVDITGKTSSSSLNVKPTLVFPRKENSLLKSDGTLSTDIALPAPCSPDVSPNRSEGISISMDETMSTSDSFKSPDVEYMDVDDLAVSSIEKKTCTKLYISENVAAEGNRCSEDIHVETETNGKIVEIDDNFEDPQFCATMACDIYQHLRASEAKKRPSTDFMEEVQKEINASMRSILIDWLVEVAEEYRLVPDTLYLTVNFIDRYLSGNVMSRQKLQLLGVACMMIAAKYEEICAPQVEEFCYITDNTYFKEEVLQMESSVLNYLKFEMTAPTAKCFLRRFVRAAQGAQGTNEVPSLQLECLANYIAELSLLEYSMLCYAPSLIAASAIFLANYMLFPSKRPWNATLVHYTLYQPSDLCDCVKDLHRLCCNNPYSNLPAIREKYSQHKYKFIAKKHCPPSIPSEFFHNLSD